MRGGGQQQARVDGEDAPEQRHGGQHRVAPGRDPWVGLPNCGCACPYTSQLTAREEEVAKLVAEANTSEQIADLLVISARTVERHRESILAKLGLRDRHGLGEAARDRAQRVFDPLADFLREEAAGGLVLLAGRPTTSRCRSACVVPCALVACTLRIAGSSGARRQHRVGRRADHDRTRGMPEQVSRRRTDERPRQRPVRERTDRDKRRGIHEGQARKLPADRPVEQPRPARGRRARRDQSRDLVEHAGAEAAWSAAS